MVNTFSGFAGDRDLIGPAGLFCSLTCVFILYETQPVWLKFNAMCVCVKRWEADIKKNSFLCQFNELHQGWNIHVNACAHTCSRFTALNQSYEFRWKTDYCKYCYVIKGFETTETGLGTAGNRERQQIQYISYCCWTCK